MLKHDEIVLEELCLSSEATGQDGKAVTQKAAVDYNKTIRM